MSHEPIPTPLLTIRQAAQLIGVSSRQIERYLADPSSGITRSPCKPAGADPRAVYIDGAALTEWAVQRAIARNKPGCLAHERARLTAAKADTLRMQVQQMAESYVRRDEVEQMGSALVAEVRARLATLPAELAASTFGATTIHEAQSRMRECVERFLYALSDSIAELGEAAVQKQRKRPATELH